MIHSGFWYLLVIALEHTVWGFCCYKPLWATQWWKIHSPCSKAWSRGWKTPPTPFYLITYPPIDSEKQQGRTVQEFPARAHHHLKESSIQLIRRDVGHSNTWVLLAGAQPSLWGFLWRGIIIRSSATVWDDFEARRTSCDSKFLRSREIYLESGSETSPMGFP